MTTGTTDIDTLQSRTIEWLRYPLMLLIVLHHTNTTLLYEMPHDGATFVLYSCLCTIVQVAVPLFFIFSGYWFFRQPETFNGAIYRTKLAKRVRTLLVPYLFWNLFAICIQIIDILIHGHADWITWDFFRPNRFLDNFVGIGDVFNGMPKAFQLWFLRDLMVMCLLSLPLYYLLREKRPWTLLLFAFMYVYLRTFKLPPVIDRFPSALLFFSVGAYMGIHKTNLIETVRKVPLWASMALSSLLLIADVWLFMRGNIIHVYTEKLFAIVTVIPTLHVASLLVERNNLRPVNWLAGSTFLLFVTHPLIINYFLVLPLGGKLPGTTLNFWLVLMAEMVTPITLCAAIHTAATHFIPRTAALLTGGRAKIRNN